MTTRNDDALLHTITGLICAVDDHIAFGEPRKAVRDLDRARAHSALLTDDVLHCEIEDALDELERRVRKSAPLYEVGN